MNRMIRFIASALMITAALGCNNKDDSKPSKLQPNKQSVVGASNKPGFFPDGTQAAPLSDDQIKSVATIAQGLVTVNEAVGTVTSDKSKSPDPKTLASSKSFQVEAVTAALKNPLIQTLIHNPQQFLVPQTAPPVNEDLEKFKNELSQCPFSQVQSYPVESGTDDDKTITQSGSSQFGGGHCPMDSKSEYSMRAHAQRLGEKSGRISFAANMKHSNQMVASNYQKIFDYMQESFEGNVEGEMVIDNQLVEAAGNAWIDGQLQTVTQGSMQAKILADIEAYGSQQSMTDGTMKIVVIIKAPGTDLLLQIFATAHGQNVQTAIYVNGKELKQTLN